MEDYEAPQRPRTARKEYLTGTRQEKAQFAPRSLIAFMPFHPPAVSHTWGMPLERVAEHYHSRKLEALSELICKRIESFHIGHTTSSTPPSSSSLL